MAKLRNTYVRDEDKNLLKSPELLALGHLPLPLRPDYEIVEAVRDIDILSFDGKAVERVIPAGTRGIRQNDWHAWTIDGEPPTIFHGMDTEAFRNPPDPDEGRTYTIGELDALRVVPEAEWTALEHFAKYGGHTSYDRAKYTLLRKLIGFPWCFLGEELLTAEHALPAS